MNDRRCKLRVILLTLAPMVCVFDYKALVCTATRNINNTFSFSHYPYVVKITLAGAISYTLCYDMHTIYHNNCMFCDAVYCSIIVFE